MPATYSPEQLKTWNDQLESAKSMLIGLQSNLSGQAPVGVKAPAGQEYGPTGQFQPISAAPAVPAVTDLTTAQDKVARDLGFGSYQDAITSLTKPTKSESDLYNSAYSAAGLDAIMAKINSRRNDLNTATGNINDNPWLTEASRVGRTRNLTQLAEGDIKNWQTEYNDKLQAVHDLVTREIADQTATGTSNKNKLALLESQAKALAAEAATKAKNTAAIPKTIKGATGATYQWNPTSQNFEQILPGKTSGTGTTGKTASKDDVASAASELSSARGADGYVNPRDWQKMMDAWTQAGYSAASFVTNFKNYANPYDSYIGLTKKTK